jgi:hypothetical protein
MEERTNRGRSSEEKRSRGFGLAFRIREAE